MPLLVFLGGLNAALPTQPALYGVGLFGDAQFGDNERSGSCVITGRLVDCTGTPIVGAVLRFTPRPSVLLSGRRTASVETAMLQKLLATTASDGSFSVTMLDPGNVWPQVTALPILVEGPYGVKFTFPLLPGLTSSTTVTGGFTPFIWAPLPVDVLNELVVDGTGTPISNAPVQLSVDGPPLTVLADGTLVACWAPVGRLTGNAGALSVGLLSGMSSGAQVRIQAGYTLALRPIVHVRRISSAQVSLSGNEVTDLTRGTGAGGDGQIFDRSTGVYAATTNQWLNSNAAIDLNSLIFGANATVTRITSDGLFVGVNGLTAFQTVLAASAGNRYIASTTVNCVANQPFSVSYFQKAVSGTPAPVLYVRTVGEVDLISAPNPAPMVPLYTVSGFTRYGFTVPASAIGSNTALHVYIDDSGSAAVTSIVCGIQVESSPTVTPYTGSFPSVNKISNSSFETDVTTGWTPTTSSAHTSVVRTQDLTSFSDGLASLKWVVTGDSGATNDSVFDDSITTAAAAGQIWEASALVSVTAITDANVNIYLDLETVGAAGSYPNSTHITAVTGGYVRLSVIYSGLPVGTTGIRARLIGIRTGTGAWTATVNWDVVQLQQIGTVTRANARVQVSPSRLSPAQGGAPLSLRLMFPSTDTTVRTLFSLYQDANNYVRCYWDGAGHFITEAKDAGTLLQAVSSLQTFSVGALYTIVPIWTSANVGISINGSVFTLLYGRGAVTWTPVSLDFGSQNGSQLINSDFFWLTGLLGGSTDVDALIWYGLLTTPPTPSNIGSLANPAFIWSASGSTYQLVTIL